MRVPPEQRLLGRLPSAKDPRTLYFLQYVDPKAAEPPDKRLWQLPISDWGIMGNNQHGNCVIVTAAHAILAWRANELTDTRRITDSAVIELSRQMGALRGYNILARLKYWRKNGMWSNKLWAFAGIDPTDRLATRIAINSCGALDIGVNLPNAWRSADVWVDGTGRDYSPGSWGGHSVPLVGYDVNYVYAVSWGDIIPMTWPAMARYCDEAYALINPDWLAADSVAPSGLNLQLLHEHLQAITER